LNFAPFDTGVAETVIKIIFSVIDHNGKLRDLPEIKRIKAKITSIERELQAISLNYARNDATRLMLRSELPSIREGRTVIALKANFRGRIRGIVHEISASGQTLFIEPEEIIEKNNDLRIARHELEVEIRRVLLEVSGALAALKNDALMFYQAVLELESFRARAHYAVSTKGVFATEASSFLLRKARHPLLENPVPVDITVKEGVKALVISGPNAGGKTAVLKTAGLFVLMRQSAFALPAAEAAMPVFDDVFFDIGDEQSLDGALSTFSAHIQNISAILNRATKHSLVLLDELGTGTGVEEGSALSMAFLDELIQRGTRLFVSTHSSALKNYAWSKGAAENASMEFDSKTMRPAFKILPGIPGESRAIMIAAQNGIKNEIIERARAYFEHGESGAAGLIDALKQKIESVEAEKNALEAERNCFEREKETLERRNKALCEREAALNAGELGELKILLAESRKKLENLVRDINEHGKKLEREQNLAVKSFLNELEENVKNAQTKNTGEYEASAFKADSGGNFEPGCHVLIGERKRPGIIKRRGKNGTWIVETGSMSLAFPEAELYPARRMVKEAVPLASLELASCEPVRAEIDLRGMRLDAALEALRRQLDQALTFNLFRFSVVHGTGDGILQRGVHQFLKEQPVVANYYFSRPELGGTGRTEVELDAH
jgi:DNA mismatch repair protein MutS2